MKTEMESMSPGAEIMHLRSILLALLVKNDIMEFDISPEEISECWKKYELMFLPTLDGEWTGFVKDKRIKVG